jgi:hypothetical protein
MESDGVSLEPFCIETLHKLFNLAFPYFQVEFAMSEKTVQRPVQIFESHSKLDEATCNQFDIAAAREGIKVFRSEYESIKAPAWETIRTEMQRSRALFLLVGPELVKAQAEGKEDWKFTQNWIAYEVGLACALGIDVWVLCDNVEVNFPVPYLNNHSIGSIQTKSDGFERVVLRKYLEGGTYPFGYYEKKKCFCPSEDCGAKFNFHNEMGKDNSTNCPTCLRKLKFPEGWLLPSK